MISLPFADEASGLNATNTKMLKPTKLWDRAKK
jgi:hypothetical protein